MDALLSSMFGLVFLETITVNSAETVFSAVRPNDSSSLLLSKPPVNPRGKCSVFECPWMSDD